MRNNSRIVYALFGTARQVAIQFEAAFESKKKKTTDIKGSLEMRVARLIDSLIKKTTKEARSFCSISNSLSEECFANHKRSQDSIPVPFSINLHFTFCIVYLKV